MFSADTLDWWHSGLTGRCPHSRVKCGIHWHAAKGRLKIWIDRKCRSNSSCLHRPCLHWSCLHSESISTNVRPLMLWNRLESKRTKIVFKRGQLLRLKVIWSIKDWISKTWVSLQGKNLEHLFTKKFSVRTSCASLRLWNIFCVASWWYFPRIWLPCTVVTPSKGQSNFGKTGSNKGNSQIPLFVIFWQVVWNTGFFGRNQTKMIVYDF